MSDVQDLVCIGDRVDNALTLGGVIRTNSFVKSDKDQHKFVIEVSKSSASMVPFGFDYVFAPGPSPNSWIFGEYKINFDVEHNYVTVSK